MHIFIAIQGLTNVSLNQLLAILEASPACLSSLLLGPADLPLHWQVLQLVAYPPPTTSQGFPGAWLSRAKLRSEAMEG